MAAGVEMLHTATLVHDDTIDNAAKRRGKPTASKIWGGGIAILVGDYLFARSAELVSRTGNLRVIRLFARTLMALCTGELEQNFSSFNKNQTRQSYFSRIEDKTASLFSTATESAGVLSEAPESAVEALRTYGSNLGMAFQIADDILDFTADENKLGKPVGSDLIQGTLTLPAILLNERYPENGPLTELFGDNNKGDKQKALEAVLDMILNSDIIPECYNIAENFVYRAVTSIKTFPDTRYRQSLCLIADHAVARQA
jgi:geranylgeranyl pyrophosphate synthase